VSLRNQEFFYFGVIPAKAGIQ